MVLTQVDDHLIRSSAHGITVITPIQFSKRRQPCRPHPILEMLVGLQVRRGVVIGVAIGELQVPVRRRGDLAQRLVAVVAYRRVDVLLGFSWP